MQNKSELFDTILRSGDYVVVTKAEVDGIPYTDGGGLVSAAVSGGLFAENHPAVGGTVSRQVELVLRDAADFARTAEIRLYCRVELGDQASKWIPKGVFYIDTRRADVKTGTMTLHGFDAMLKASPNYIDTEEASGLWPRKARFVVEDIAYRMGVELDEQTVLQDYDVGFMPLTSGREILRWVAAMHGGNWVITDAGKLRLVPLVAAGDGFDLGTDMEEFETAPEFAPFTGVQFYYEDKDTVFAGNDEGRVLQVECPWATQEIADAVLEKIRGYVYRPYEATRAVLDPAVEVGDPVLVNGTDSVLASCNTTFNALMVSDIAAPNDEEIDHEYPYTDPNRNRTRREIAKAKADIQVGVDQINAVVEGINGELSKLELEVDGITLEVINVSTSGGQTYARIRLRGGNGEWQEGQILLDGNVNVSGQLSAEALYAILGDVAKLTVNRLSTSRRIPMYLKKIKDDDNYIDIQDQHITLRRAWTDGSTEQARTPDGALLYWEQDVSNATLGENGYPFIDGVQIPTTTTESPYPVMVYVYQEGDRWKQTFAEDGSYGPQQVWGEGDGTSSGKGRGYIEKLGLSFDVYNLSTDGVKRGIFMDNEFTRITGEPRPSKIVWGDNSVTVTLEDGSSGTLSFTKDSSGNITTIKYPDGHTVEVS